MANKSYVTMKFVDDDDDIQNSAGASLNPPNYRNWPSIFWQPFLVVTLLNNDRL